MGIIMAQGNGLQVGVGTLASFDAVFTGTVFVANPGDVTYEVVAADDFLLGIGGGATRVNGAYENPPESGLSPFNEYPLVGAFNQSGGATPQTHAVTVHFPAAGFYPYELDYFECCGEQLSLTMTAEKFTVDTAALSGFARQFQPRFQFVIPAIF